MLAEWLPGHSRDLSTLFVPFRLTVGVVYRSEAASGFHHIIDACVIYSSALFLLWGRRSRRPFLIPLVPDDVLFGGRVRSWLTSGSLGRFFCALQTLASTLTTGALPRA